MVEYLREGRNDGGVIGDIELDDTGAEFRRGRTAAGLVAGADARGMPDGDELAGGNSIWRGSPWARRLTVSMSVVTEPTACAVVPFVDRSVRALAAGGIRPATRRRAAGRPPGARRAREPCWP